MKIFEITTLTIKSFIYVYFFLPLVFLGFLVYPDSDHLTDDSQTRRSWAPDKKTSLGFKNSSKQGHKTKVFTYLNTKAIEHLNS